MSFFSNASGTVINGGTFVNKDNASKDLTPLYDKVAPNAILNSGGRADPIRCHPGTREEVIEKMEKRITDHNTGDRRVFWLSGPAGAGKSAIMQTVAERCIERKVPMASFFFFRADGTRNHSDPVVATLLYQLFDLYPALMARVSALAARNPVIFRKSMQEQFSALIEAPLQAISPSSGNTPLVILIDGLDECSSGNGKDDQVSFLNILHDISIRPVSPTAPTYVVLVASRTEAHLTKAFNRIGYHPNSIYLDDSYRPSNDIRLFLTDEFSEIKRTHNLKNSLPEDWPSSDDINALVEKSSGQFVYPTTVTRFISNSAASPKRSLEIVMGLRPPLRTSPFATLDALYTYILSQAEDWSSVRDILATQIILNSSLKHLIDSQMTLTTVIHPLGYTEDDVLSSLPDLTAIIQFRTGDWQLTIYHASLNDFLTDAGRAGDFYVDVNVFACRLAPLHFRQCVDCYHLSCCFRILQAITEPDEQLTDFLKDFFPDPKPFRKGDVTSNDLHIFITILESLYMSRNPALLENIRKRWEAWLSIVNQPSGALEHKDIPEETSSLQPCFVQTLQTAATQPSLRPSAQLSPHPSTPPLLRPSAPRSPRPSTSLSRFLTKFMPKRNRHAKTKK